MAQIRFILWALIIGIFAFALGTYGSLPELIPSGIDANGAARGWQKKSLLSWLGPAFLMLLLQLGLEVLRHFIPTKPQLFNFPDKERFLKLPREYQAPVITVMQQTMDIVGLSVVLTFGYVQYLMWLTARGESTGSSVMFLLVGGIMMTPLILIFASRITTAAEEAEKRWKADTRTAG